VSTALLFLFVVAAFYLPMRLHFWGGYDDFASLQDNWAVVWSDDLDRLFGRPLIGLQVLVAGILTPDRIEGVLYVASGLCFLNALLLMGIIRRLLPGGTLLALGAAILFVVNRSEPLIFFAGWATNFYWMALFWFMLGLYLLLISYGCGWRWLLVASCSSLGAALLTNEGLLPLALIGPLLLYLLDDDRPRLTVWTFAWLGTAVLFGIRFAAHLLDAGAYQEKFLKSVKVQDTLAHAGRLLRGAGSYLDAPGSLPGHWGYWLLAVGLAVAAAALVRDSARRVHPSAWLVGTAVAAAANILAVAPFTLFGTVDRAQYFAVPAQAAFVACGLGLLVSIMPFRVGRIAATAVLGLLVANAGALAWRSQEAAGASIRFDKTVHVFEQVHAISPSLPTDTLLLFVLEEGAATPLGVGYHVFLLSRLVLGVTALQVNSADRWNVPRLGPDGVDIPGLKLHYRYDQVVAFRLSADGTVALLAALPESLVPIPGLAAAYAPLARLRAGPIDQLRFLRYVSWSDPALDIFDTNSGVMLGANWGPLVDVQGHVGRWADNDAELIVNPASYDRVRLRFDLEPRPELKEAASELVVLDAAGAVLQRAQLRGARQQIQWELPVAPDRVARLRLRVQVPGDDRNPPPGSFRVMRFERKAAADWQRVLPDRHH
jgi:hypothetical protein